MLSKEVELMVGFFAALGIAALLMLALVVANNGISGNSETYQLAAGETLCQVLRRHIQLPAQSGEVLQAYMHVDVHTQCIYERGPISPFNIPGPVCLCGPV